MSWHNHKDLVNSEENRFNEIYNKYKNILYFQICTYTQNLEIVNIILDETFTKTRGELLKKDKIILAQLLRQNIDNIKKITGAILLEPTQLNIDNETIKSVIKILDKMEFYVFSYRVVYNLSFKNIAVILGLGKIRCVHLFYRAYRKLKNKI